MKNHDRGLQSPNERSHVERGGKRMARWILSTALVGSLTAAVCLFLSPSLPKIGDLPPVPAQSATEIPHLASGETEPEAPIEAELGEAQSDSPPEVVAVEADSEPETDLPLENLNTREVLTELFQLDISQGFSRARAIGVAEKLKQLVAQKAEALPVIGEFLEKNQDLSFQDVPGGKHVGHPSVRAGLIDAIREIGGPEAIALTRRTLQTTAEPAEIARLARNLEQMAPGQFRQEAIDAARETLEQAASGALGKRDVAPLFHLAETYGGTDLVHDLANQYPQWHYYSAMALASLPEGQGVPTLIKAVQENASQGGARGIIALQMLAQVSAQYPEAASMLLEQARANKIPNHAWSQIADGLGGDQYQYGTRLLDDNVPPELESAIGRFQVRSNQNFYVHTPAARVPGLKTYHIENSNQNFYSVPASDVIPPEEISLRLGTIDELIKLNPNGSGIPALQRARASLERRLQN